MATLPSGLLEHIDDEEDLARFLTQSSHFNATATKRVAFMPEPIRNETSVSRHGRELLEDLWRLGEAAAGGRALYGAALVKAKSVRKIGLDAVADEPPPRHAVIRGWPVMADDPQEHKSKLIELALELARAAGPPLLRRVQS